MSANVIVEERREIPVIDEVDVVVVGGGSAGMPAAVAAARCGARTALIERWGYVGGAATGGLVLTVPESAGIWGIEREFYEELETMGGIGFDEWRKRTKVFIVSAPLAKHLGDLFLQREKVKLYYHRWCVGVSMDGSRIDAVIVESKSGRHAIRAKMFVDATGDADLAAFAGAPFEKGDPDGKMHSVTGMYMIANANLEKFQSVPGAAAKIPQPFTNINFTFVNTGEVNCWGGNIPGDGTDADDLTRMEIELRARIVAEAANMRKNLIGFEDAYLAKIAEQLGVRETRRITADYVVTTEDAEAKTVFDDSIGVAYDFTIPYRSLIPVSVDNLLVSGRCIGTDQKTQNRIRIIPCCFTSGQAAGAAAALAADAGAGARDVKVAALQGILKDGKVELGER